jgi:hypothetical protein
MARSINKIFFETIMGDSRTRDDDMSQDEALIQTDCMNYFFAGPIVPVSGL